ncbi:MAG: exonuclease subunit SbcD, partial [Clostridia bacterium]|nr:exonuclease subunit SbcD [Clostridia bacterium]
MIFAHLADLHIGRRFGDFSMFDDQVYALDAIIESLRDIRPDAVFIAGDVYDKSSPSEDAVKLADEFITKAVEICPHVFLISGNHDSLARLSFAGRVLSRGGLHLPREYAGRLESVQIDGISIWPVSYIRPREAAR